jgi:hypothetical protein
VWAGRGSQQVQYIAAELAQKDVKTASRLLVSSGNSRPHEHLRRGEGTISVWYCLSPGSLSGVYFQDELLRLPTKQYSVRISLLLQAACSPVLLSLQGSV